MSKNSLLITNANVVTRDRVLEGGAVLVQDGIIQRVISTEEADQIADVQETLNADGAWLLPGFVDVHVHGGGGGDFMDASAEAFDAITRFHAAHGTTAMLATTVTQSREALTSVFEAVNGYQGSYARLVGIHLEGPFVSPKMAGAQNPSFMLPPQQSWLEAWEEQYPGLLRLLTLAPEYEGALELIEWLDQHGIVAACGHTEASYDRMQEAAQHGLRHAVHTFNAMKGLHHREPGTVGAVLTDDRIVAEIIADGHHVHPAGIALLARMKTKNNLVLITDAISAAGLGNGQYSLGGLDVTVKDGVATLTHGNSLAGSTLTMIGALRFMVERVGLSVAEASELASYNPAKQLGMEDRIGSIARGLQADLLLVGKDLNIQKVWIEGSLVS